MVNTVSFAALVFATTAAVTSGASMRAEAAPMPDGSWPTSQGNEYLSAPYTVKRGEVFDGKMKTFQRSNVKCRGQEESGWQTAVFVIQAGGTLKNVIVGTDQMEGVHCEHGDCLVQNVWWNDVCEDALSIKGGSASSVTRVIGGGARSAADKVVQHNGYGSVFIEGFYVQDFGKLYRSCSNCGNKGVNINIKNVFAVNGRVSILTENKGDHATVENIKIKGKKVDVCSVGGGGTGATGIPCNYSSRTITYV
uniref:Probable pectate lyase F n=1 Tax=Peronospora matthiolae TaxID=2874970 RepID=A0AAV1TP88_9STRA